MLFSLPVGTEMFHFPTFPPHTLYIQMRVTRHHSCWVSPFGHPRITARLTAPRGLSQPPTSFIGSWCQGIHRTLLKTYKTKMLASTVQFSNNTPTQTESPDLPANRLTVSREIRMDRIILPGKNVCSFRTQQCVDISTTTRTLSSRSNAIEVVSVPPMSNHRKTFASEMASARNTPTYVSGPGEMLLRKEVIQPHLPVRLPCYDFVPIADPTFDGSLHKG